MTMKRREFIRTSVGTSAAIVAGSATPWAFARKAPLGRADRSLKILILGGTRFLGPATVDAALARGHTVTLFNRGRSNTELFPDIEKLYGDRDPKKADERKGEDGEALEPRWGGGEGLKSIANEIAGGRRWDVVVDTSGYFPRIAKASAQLLAPAVEHYTFISTVSVYAGFAEPGRDESATIGTIEDPTIESFGNQFQNYGPLKALCEQEIEKAMPGRVANVRPGLIVGPRDSTDRFTYWPVRVSRGGEVLAPGTPDDPIQLIDVRDLAEFVIHLAERRTAGVFNALGPKAGELTIGKLLTACKSVSGSDASFTWADAEFLASNGVQPWAHMPVWIPPQGETAGFHRWDVSASVAAGLAFRPVEDIVKGTLDWWNGLTDEQRNTHGLMQDPPRSGISAAREKELLASWHEQHG